MFSRKARSAVFALGVLVGLAMPLPAQRTALTTGSNSFSTQQDIEMGRALSRDAESTLTLSEDATTRGYISRLGNELAARAPGYRYPYEFKIFDDPDNRSMALPGGIIYVSSGLVLATKGEPQLASILAHQIGHVAARHGTQQVSAEYSKLSRPARITVSNAISRLNLTAGPDSIATRYNSQAELQADTLATQILYDTRFDPRQIPTVFQSLVDQQDNGSRDFAFNHPTPPNRTAAIRRELQRLGPLPGSWRGDSAAFRAAQQNLRDETEFGLARVDDNRAPADSSRWTVYRAADFEISHPDNWRVDESGDSVILAPAGGIVSGELAYGMMLDNFKPESRNIFGRNDFSLPTEGQTLTTLSEGTDQLIDKLQRSNPNLRVTRRTSRRVDGFSAMAVELNNDSPLGGTEIDHLTTVLHSNGQLYYFLGVTRQSDNYVHSPIFDRMVDSIRFD